MQITFDTTTITDDEVRGISALLYTVRAAAFDPDNETERAVSGDFFIGRIKSGGSVYESDTVAPLREEDGIVTNHPLVPPAIQEAVLEQMAPTTDSTGLPWDERIHASSKALNADGTWRTKRGVDKALVAEVEAELRHDQNLSATDEELIAQAEPIELPEAKTETVVPPAPPAPPAVPEVPLVPKAPTAPVPIVADGTYSENASPVATVAPSSAVSPFVALMKRVTTAQGAGKLTQPRVKELLESLDKKSIMDLRTDEDALASFAVLLDGEGV